MNEQKNEKIDETKVDIAVRFLSNSNVKETEKEKQESFLKSKGLSAAEIAVAYQRVSEIEFTETDDDSWSLFDYLKGIVLSAGILSAANFAYKAYILPYATRELKDDMRMEGLVESFQAVKDDIKQHTYELTGTLKQIQVLMEENQKSLSIINSGLRKDTSDVSSITELKSEISSIKSMMLSKDQFPATPYTTVHQKVNEIPAWQRIAEEFTSDKLTEEPSGNKTTVGMNKDQEGGEVCSKLNSGKPLVEVLGEEQTTFVSSDSNTEEHVTLVNDVDAQVESDITTDSIIVEKHSAEMELTDEELCTVTHNLELQYSNIHVSQFSRTNENETVLSEQEHEEDVPVTTEVNGILYEVVPSVEQLPSECNNEMFSTEISTEIFLEGTDVVKSEYDLTITHISESDEEHNVVVEKYAGMDTDILVKDELPCEMQDEVPSEHLADDIATSVPPDDAVTKS